MRTGTYRMGIRLYSSNSPWGKTQTPLTITQNMLRAVGDENISLRCRQLRKSFAARFAFLTKQVEISNHLDTLRIDDVKKERDDQYVAMGKLTNGIN